MKVLIFAVLLIANAVLVSMIGFIHSGPWMHFAYVVEGLLYGATLARALRD